MDLEGSKNASAAYLLPCLRPIAFRTIVGGENPHIESREVKCIPDYRQDFLGSAVSDVIDLGEVDGCMDGLVYRIY